MTKHIFLALISIFMFSTAEAQILGRVLDQVQRRIEDKVVDAIADEIVKRAFRPIEVSMDSILRQKYQDSVAHGERVDWDKVGKSYNDFLNSMNEKADLPDKYTFDIVQEVEITDYDKSKSNVRLYYSKKDAILGFASLESKKESQLVVFDVQRDAMIMYKTDKDGIKSAQVVSNISKLTKGIMDSFTASEDEEKDDYTFAKTGKTKKIVSYICDEYRGTSSKEETVFYIAKNFPINVSKTAEAYLNRFTPSTYNYNMSKVSSGPMMEYQSTLVQDKKKKTTWITKNVIEKTVDFVNAEYGIGKQ